MTSQTPDQVLLPLTVDEAIVLFEILLRYSDTDTLNIEDQAEQRALWNLCCIFEKQMVQPLDGNYVEILKAARARLRDTN